MQHCEFCHRPFIPDVYGMNPKILEAFEEDQFIVHEHCAQEIIDKMKEKKGNKEQNKVLFEILKKISAACIVLYFLIACGVKAFGSEINSEKEWIKGSVVIGIKNDGGCVFKPFVKVGDAEDNSDNDKSQILGYSPGNVYVDGKGQVVFERVYEEQFIPLHQHRSVHGRLCSCPPYNE